MDFFFEEEKEEKEEEEDLCLGACFEQRSQEGMSSEALPFESFVTEKL